MKYQPRICKRSDCEYIAQCHGLCAMHYHEFVFGGLPELREEPLNTCWNPVCGAEIEQYDDSLDPLSDGLTRRIYCDPCGKYRRGGTRTGFNQRKPAAEWEVADCYKCGRVEDWPTLLKGGGLCPGCRKK